MSGRLTKPQEALLDEIRQSSTGGLWIRMSGRYARTALALLDRGRVKITERDYAWGRAFFAPVLEPTEQEST